MRVLLLDDDQTTLVRISAWCRQQGFETTTALSGDEAIKSFQEMPADIVFVDWELPDTSGGEVCQAIRESPYGEEAYIAVITAREDQDAVLEALDKGADDYQVKPLTGPQILSRLKIGERVAAHRRRLRETSKVLKTKALEFENLKAVIDRHAIVSATNVGGDITFVNDKFCEISGFSEQEIIGQNHRIINSGEHPPEFFEELWKTIASGKVWEGDIRNKAKDGGSYWVRSTIAPFKNEKGRIYQYLSVRTDITEYKELMEKLDKARIEAERANRSKSEFLSMMSHELRTPLNVILGYSQLLQSSRNSQMSEKEKKGLANIYNASEHLLSLINDLLDLSKIEARKLKLEFEVVQVIDVCDDVLNLAKPLAKEKGITLESQYPEKMPNAIAADPLRLKQVLFNLVSNAIKYNKAEGSATIAVEEREDQLLVSVTDTGKGIAEENISSVFNAFERLGEERGASTGTGIGLTITRHLVHAMEGEIGVESEVDKGSRFWVSFPTVESDESGTPTKRGIAKITGKVTQSTSRVLYVEDNQTNVDLIEQIFQSFPNASLKVLPTAEEALNYLTEHTCDLILLDINLPGMNGYDFLEELQKDSRNSDIPVIAISANAMPSDTDRGIQAGFIDYITKPIRVDDFVTRVFGFLDSQVLRSQDDDPEIEAEE